MNDAELVQQVLNENKHAFRFLVSKYQRLVLHIAGRIVQQQDELDDVCQEVFIKVFRKIGKYRGEAKLSTWIATIAYNTSISHMRKKAGKRETSYEEEPRLLDLEMRKGCDNNGLEKKEAKKYLLELIEKLPEKHRTVLTLFHLEEFSYKEIEEITGMPEGTVKSYLSRARNRLKQSLEKVVEKEKTNIFVDYERR